MSEKRMELMNPATMSEKRIKLMNSATMSSQQIKLISSDGSIFYVDKDVVEESKTIMGIIEEESVGKDTITLPQVTGAVLSKVILYLEKHFEARKSDKRGDGVEADLKAWDADFVKANLSILYDLILAADYLDFESLLNLTGKAAVRMNQPVKCCDHPIWKQIYPVEEEKGGGCLLGEAAGL